MLRLNILLALIYVNTCFAQERSFRFGVGPATTFALVQQPHNTVAAAYRSGSVQYACLKKDK